MLVIKNGRVFTAAGKNYDRADVLIDGGKIAAVGENLAVPEGAEVIDAEGLFVMPGIVDAHSHVGGFGIDPDLDADLNEMTNPATPEVESFYAIDSASPHFPRVRAAGITTSAIAPGSGNVIGGLVCACKSAGRTIEQMCIRNPIALKMALGGNPKGVYGKLNKLPMTRMGIAQVIRDNFNKAKEYMEKQREAGDDKTKMPPYDAGLENICRVLRREIPVKVHCEQFDMLTTMRIAEEFNIRFTIDHAWGASDFYDEMEKAARGNMVGVIYGPIGVGLSPGECGKVDIDCLSELERRGVLCSIMTDGPIMNPDLIVGQAGEAVRLGLSHESALKMLTINPARIIGLDERIGSLEAGKDADVAIFSGIPAMDTAARCVRTLIDGETVYKE